MVLATFGKGNPFSNAKPDPMLTCYNSSCLENGPIFLFVFSLFLCFVFFIFVFVKQCRFNINDFRLFVLSLHQC